MKSPHSARALQALARLRPILHAERAKGADAIALLELVVDDVVHEAHSHGPVAGLILLKALFALPLRVAKPLGYWHGFGFGTMSDAEARALLEPHLVSR